MEEVVYCTSTGMSTIQESTQQLGVTCLLAKERLIQATHGQFGTHAVWFGSHATSAHTGLVHRQHHGVR